MTTLTQDDARPEDALYHELDEDPYDPRRLSRGRRILLRIAGAHLSDISAPSDRKLYATIGVLLGFFFVYATLAYYAFFARIGITEVAKPPLGVAVGVATAMAIALVLTLFDRVLVSYIASFPRPRRRRFGRASRSEVDVTTRRRIVVPLLGRAIFALLIGIFATQTIESYIFRKSIHDERITAQRAVLTQRKTAAKEARVGGRTVYKQRLSDAKTAIKEANTSYQRARVGQGPKRCTVAVCPDLRKDLEQAITHKNNLVSPDSKHNHFTKDYDKARDALDTFNKEPDAHLPKSSDPLDDVKLLYRHLAKSFWARVYYAVLMLFLLGVDMGAIALKFSLARDTRYERQIVEQEQHRWALTKERLAYGKTRVSNRIETRAAEAAIEERVVRDAFVRMSESESVLAAADVYAEESLAARIARRPLDPGGAEPADDPDPTGAVPAPPGQSEPATPPSAQPLAALELLSVSAGIVALAYALGGSFVYAQLRKVELPVDVLWTMPPGHLLVIGAGLTLLTVVLTIPMYWLVKFVTLRGLDLRVTTWVGEQLTRRQRAAETAESQSEEAPRRRKRKARPQNLPDVRREPPVRGRDLTPRDLSAGAIFATSGLAATGLGIDDIATLGLLEGAGLGLIGLGLVAVLWILGVMALVRGSAGWGRFGLTACAVGFMFVSATGLGAVRPLKLATATVRLKSGSQPTAPKGKDCVVGGFVGREAGGAYLVDGANHRLRFFPDADIEAISVASGSSPVRRTPIRWGSCTGAFAIATPGVKAKP